MTASNVLRDRQQRYLIKILPEVLRHKSEGTQVSGHKVVETSVPIVRIRSIPGYNKYPSISIPTNVQKLRLIDIILVP